MSAQLTLVPIEVVQPHEFTGKTASFNAIMDGGYEGKIANVKFKFGEDLLHRIAVAVPGQRIAWTAAMSVDVGD